MSTARYRAFVAVAQQGSLSAAARALGVSQPTVSSQIATLERQSQIELFHRQGYRMALTGAGRKFLALAQKIIAVESVITNASRLLEQNKHKPSEYNNTHSKH